MATTITSPRFSFVQFSGLNTIGNCVWPNVTEVLPVVEDSDIWFQFILTVDDPDDADILCGDTGGDVTVGIAYSCADADLITFSESPERQRIDANRILYNWKHGLPLFQTVIDVSQCFVITVRNADNVFCSNLFKRFPESCFTSVLEYGNDDNFADFHYCGGLDDITTDCTPTEVSFTNVLEISIPYTVPMVTKYGIVPSVQVWIYDDTGVLVDMGIRITLDAFPPSTIYANFGGLASGIVKIS